MRRALGRVQLALVKGRGGFRGEGEGLQHKSTGTRCQYSPLTLLWAPSCRYLAWVDHMGCMS